MPFFRTTQDPLAVALLTLTPPSLLWSGREAVLLFFVLSGYVLAQAFLRGPQPWLPFVLRRACRLLLPCIAVALPVGLLVVALDPVPHPGWSEWANGHWMQAPRPGKLLSHALLLSQPYDLNSPLWSLHYEWRLSLVFPLLMLLAAAGPGTALIVSVLAAAVAAAEYRLTGVGWISPLLFVPHFMLGVLLAQEGPRLPVRIAALSPWRRGGLWALCYVLLTWRWLAPGPALSVDLVNGLGAALLIALVLSSARAQAVLGWPPVAWLGKVSFSLYLVHVPVILAALHLAPADWPLWPVLAGAVLVSLLLAGVLFHLVERPSIWLGRALSRRVSGAAARAAA